MGAKPKLETAPLAQHKTASAVRFDSDAIQNLALSAISAEPKVVGAGTPFLLVPEGFGIESLEHLLVAPARERAKAELLDVASFVAYVRPRKTDRSVFTASRSEFRVSTILDFHHPGRGPAFGEHRAALALKTTPEWSTWFGANKKRMGQHDFAEFLEDNLPDVAFPSGATLLETATALRIEKKVNFLSSTRLQDGNREFVYQEAQEATADKGALRVPESFTLGLAPFEGSAKYEIAARLRFRLEEGKLALWFELVRPHKVIEDAFKHVVSEISTALDVTVLTGAVEIPK